jgi:uncharacterized tellurite resistance protein B-like protein
MNVNNETLKSIRNDLYGEENDVPLNDKDLLSVLLTFPAAMVAVADEEVDETERMFLLKISEQLGDDDAGTSHRARLESAERYRAFMWLLNEQKRFEEPILNGIKILIQENPDVGEKITNMLWGVAESSDGVSESEQKEISRITEALGISNTLN